MKKQTQISEQVPKYESVEQKLERNILRPLGNEAYDFGKAFYGIVAPIFKIPTTIRKIANEQNIFYNQREEFKGGSNGLGVLAGMIAGFLTDIVLTGNMINQEILAWKFTRLENPEYLLYGWLATNVLFGAYELGRFSRSRLEHRALNESKLEKNPNKR